MRNLLLALALVLALAGCAAAQPVAPQATTPPAASQPLAAFPGAEGWGALAQGGRGGRVIAVTNLADAGPGSLRACVEASGPRFCIFRVSGVIELKRTIEVRNPYLTIAGQTAPAGGITIRSAPENPAGINGLIELPRFAADYRGEFPHDIVIRYLRIRHGRSPTQKADGERPKNLEIWSGQNIMIDHVSLGWVNDNLMTIISPDLPERPPVQAISVQRTIFAEALDGHSTGLNVQGQGEGDQENWRNVRNISIHHNLFTSNGSRNPRVTAAGAQVVNNVIYNWRYHATETTRGSIVDWVGNYWNPGPSSNTGEIIWHEDRPTQGAPPYRAAPSIYMQGNQYEGWLRWSQDWELYTLPYRDGAALPAEYRRAEALPAPPIPIAAQGAEQAYAAVLDDVGANRRLDCAGRWVVSPDDADARVVREVRANTGAARLLYHEDAVGGFVRPPPAQPCPDADQDGMPDEWERLHALAPGDGADSSADDDGDGYTNIEEYLNGSDPRAR